MNKMSNVIILEDDLVIGKFYTYLLSKNLKSNCCASYKIYNTYIDFSNNLKDNTIYVIDFLLGGLKNGIDAINLIKSQNFSNVKIILYSAIVSNEFDKFNLIPDDLEVLILEKPNTDKLLDLIRSNLNCWLLHEKIN